jgi:transposase
MFWIGIDVGKSDLQVALMDQQGKVVEQTRIANKRKDIHRWVRRWRADHELSKENTLVCMEHTGHYIHEVLEVLLEEQLPTWVAHALDIQRSLGLQRGKNDRVDALRIAQYARRFQDKAQLFRPDHLALRGLKELLARRDQLVGQRAVHRAQLTDTNRYAEKALRRFFDTQDQRSIALLDKQIQRMDAMIEKELGRSTELEERYLLLLTIPGVGHVLAIKLLCATDNFLRFTTARQLACHAGVAPFDHSSGSSIKGRPRVSPLANRSLKCLLHMAALSVIRPSAADPVLREYYRRKVAQGKNKMSVINAVRNKIIHRVFAVIQQHRPYSLQPLASVIE